MDIEKLLAEKYLYSLKMDKPSEYWKCYRSLRYCKIYVVSNKSYYGKDRPSDYYLHDTKSNKLYSIFCGSIGGIAGFIRLLEGKPTDFAPIEILKLARTIVKRREATKPNDQISSAIYYGNLSALEELARQTNNLDIAEEILQLK